MRKLLPAILLLGSVMLPPAGLCGSADKGTSGAPFLKLPSSARSAALGQAYTALASGADAVFVSPAGLGEDAGGSCSFSHASLFGELGSDFLGCARRLGVDAVGAGVQYLSAGKVAETDSLGFETGGTMRPRDMAVSLSYARAVLSDKVTAGLTVKYIDSRLDTSASAFAADIGVRSDISKRLKLAFTAKNLGGELKFDQEADPLPRSLVLGAAWSVGGGVTGVADISLPRDNGMSAAFGAEYSHLSGSWVFSGRAGYNTLASGDISGAGPSLGGGAAFRSGKLDYAFMPFGALGQVHIFSLTAKF
ncbi:MAG: PorV/PorQ family protein [Nitrospiraceae bacterium]|nr:PorV/PorQ family protein [Nitrospiraceae bacterium]